MHIAQEVRETLSSDPSRVQKIKNGWIETRAEWVQDPLKIGVLGGRGKARSLIGGKLEA
jgi:hypothetical protein